MTGNDHNARFSARQNCRLATHRTILAVERPEDQLLGARRRKKFAIRTPTEGPHTSGISRHAHVLGIHQPPTVECWLLHGRDQKFSIRADRYSEMRSLPFEPFGLSAGRVRKPERGAVVMRDRKTEAFRQKAKSGNGRGRLKRPQLTFLRADMCSFAGRPGKGVVWAHRNVVDPAFLVIRSDDPVLAIRTSFPDHTVIATGYDARSVGRACQDSACVNRDTVFSLGDKRQFLLAKHEHGRSPKEVHADD